MNEVNLLQYDVDIKSSLQLSSADTARCISVLEKYKTLDVTALMLKKNPQVAETIKRLRRYVGNTKEWNFTDEEQIEFDDKAAKIRKLAEAIYKNFKVIETHFGWIKISKTNRDFIWRLLKSILIDVIGNSIAA